MSLKRPLTTIPRPIDLLAQIREKNHHHYIAADPRTAVVACLHHAAAHDTPATGPSNIAVLAQYRQQAREEEQ
ncbi:hypothetical protein C8035_v007702 [Colletotrichum spinosum]|uniref:Uncharacterized protein n=1 Tax=Colletotrichum spinosum TaxID=1347390 RepID=A0A4V3HTD9_9PEZI|nr:hypothetical protein C8035_v007702 [Colletotrichum spinosum]